MDGFEPHGTIPLTGTAALTSAVYMLGSGVGGRCTRGGAVWVGPGGCYTGTLPGPLQIPIFNIFLRLSPTHGPKKAISEK